MTQSTEIGELAAALAKAQGEFQTVAYDSTNPHFRNRYASLAAFESSIRPVLSRHGLSYAQLPDSADGQYRLYTRLMHSSGQWLQRSIGLMLQKQDMQGLGSAITYARRYALAAIVGLSADEDDDAEQAIAKPKIAKPQAASVTQAPEWANEPDPAPRPPAKRAQPNRPAATTASGWQDYVIRFGKHTGRTLEQIGVHQAVQYLEWLEGQAKQSGKGLTTSAEEFKKHLSDWQRHLTEQVELMPLDQPPKFDPTDEIPF
jgi:hypothetical protein